MNFIKFQTAFTTRSRPTRSFFRFTSRTRKPLEETNGSRMSSSTSVETGENNQKNLLLPTHHGKIDRGNGTWGPSCVTCAS